MGAAFTLREKVILCILAGLVLVGGAWRLLQRAPPGRCSWRWRERRRRQMKPRS